jgi:hypothetical protein
VTRDFDVAALRGEEISRARAMDPAERLLSEPTKPASSGSAGTSRILRSIRSYWARSGPASCCCRKEPAKLEGWFELGISRLRCLPWDATTGARWAQLLADLRRNGRAMPIKDSLIAATALLHGLTVATRNVAHFQTAGVRVVNPFGE